MFSNYTTFGRSRTQVIPVFKTAQTENCFTWQWGARMLCVAKVKMKARKRMKTGNVRIVPSALLSNGACAENVHVANTTT